MREKLHVETMDPFIVIYHGAVVPDRGIEKLLHILALNENLAAIILGDGSAVYIDGLKEQARQLNVEHRVIFHDAVPHTELWKYLGAADLGFVIIEGRAKSYYYSLPNKLFENIQAGIPVLASDFPEMKRIIDEFGVGMTCDPNDLDGLNACIEQIRLDRSLYAGFKSNMEKAKAELCWENEKQKLLDAINKLTYVS